MSVPEPPAESTPELRRQEGDITPRHSLYPTVRRHGAGYSRTRMATWVLLADGLGIAVAVALGSILAPANTAWSWWLGSLSAPVICYMLGGYSFPARSHRAAVLAAGIAGGMVVGVATLWSRRPDLGLVWVLGIAAWPMAVRGILGRRLTEQAGRSRWLAIGSTADLTQIRQDHEEGHFTGELRLLASDNGLSVEDPLRVGSADELIPILEQSWSGVILGGGASANDRLMPILMRARLAGLRIFDAAEFAERYTLRVPIHHVHDAWVVLAQGFALIHDAYSLRLKRLSDLATSALILLLTLPVIIVAMLAVRLTSRGPIFFSQNRVGLNGNLFTCFKFRTMYVGSERGDRYTQVGDKRITIIGGFLRKTRIDELPQLWNVLAGDMSFIGPRAEWDELVRGYEAQIPYYQMRHLVKPGLTGWAQVHYPYGASVEDAKRKLEFDLYYIKRFSLFLDVRILLKTARVILVGAGR